MCGQEPAADSVNTRSNAKVNEESPHSSDRVPSMSRSRLHWLGSGESAVIGTGVWSTHDSQRGMRSMFGNKISALRNAATAAAMLLAVAASALGAGQAIGIKHPVLAHGIDPAEAASYEQAVKRVMAMSDEEMLAFVPEKPAVLFCHCPNCHGGSQGQGYDWSIERPNEVTCSYCGTVYPNDKYRQDQTMTGQNALGETITYRYHQDRTRPDLQIFIDGHILFWKRDWITNQLLALGRAYHATAKPEYARRAVLILNRVAQVYPHYPVMEGWITCFRFAKSQQPPYPWAGGRWGRWMPAELDKRLILAYDLVYDSDEFDKLSQLRGHEVREKLENDFFKETFEYVNNNIFEHHTDNMSPQYLGRAIQLGRVINEPRYVHWAYYWLRETLYGGCFYDGIEHETSPSYHYQTMRNLNIAFQNLRGYTDPHGYVDEVDGTRFDDLDPVKDNPFFAKARDAFAVVGFPNGTSPPVHDSWPNKRHGEPRDKTVSALLPGCGHASLGFGEHEHQTQAQLHFSGAYGHRHLDNLNLLLFAKGREMLCDLGYSHDRVRHWTRCTVGHNLVAIDRLDQVGLNDETSDGDLLRFFAGTNGVSMVEADGKRAYPNIEGLRMYRRMLVLVPISGQDAYVVDLFSTIGGQRHDWLLHGDADYDMTATCSIELPRSLDNMLEEGEEWVEPETQGWDFIPYGVIREVSAGYTDGPVTATFTYNDRPDTGVVVHAIGGTDTEVFLGRSPSVRRAGGDNRRVFDFWIPQLVLRRTGSGQGPLESLFAVVEEPFAGQPFIDAVSRVQISPPDDHAIALQVRHGDTTDTIIRTLDDAPYPVRTTADGVTLKGRLSIVRREQGNVTGMWLFEGESLRCDGARLSMPVARHEGEIVAATRKADGAAENSFITDADLPEGSEMHGLWMIVTHGNGYKHGYQVDRIEKQSGETVIVLTMDHGLRIEGDTTTEVFFPRREIAGTNTFVIPLAASTAA